MYLNYSSLLYCQQEKVLLGLIKDRPAPVAQWMSSPVLRERLRVRVLPGALVDKNFGLNYDEN